MVHYPDPGPCNGTSGSPVKACPNHPHSENQEKREIFGTSRKVSNVKNVTEYFRRKHISTSIRRKITEIE